MDRENFNKIVEARCESIKTTLVKKGEEYSTANNVFHNFDDSVGIAFAKSPEMVAWEYMSKHLQSIRDLVEQTQHGYAGFPKEEMINEKIGDAVNYLILIEGMFKQRIKEYNNRGINNYPF